MVVTGALAASCAARVMVPPAPTAPRYPDFVYPQPPSGLGDDRTRAAQLRGWQLLQNGDIKGAERELLALVKRTPAFYPGEVALAYALVAGQKPTDALGRVDRVLRQFPRYAPALAGKGEVLLASQQHEAAISSFEAALAADPGLSDLTRRLDVLRFGRVRELMAQATNAADAGRWDEARRAYEAAVATSPTSAFLYRDLGAAELRLHVASSAVAHLRQALALDDRDPRAWLLLGEALEQQGALSEAVSSFERAYALEASDAARKAIDRLRDRAATAAFPAEYRAIASLSQVTRGDLAALLGVRVQPAIPAGRNAPAVVATDVRGHWAAAWILSVTRAGFMEVYANHTFQPRAAVRRIELAQVVTRALAAAGVGLRRPPEVRIPIADLGVDHLSYPDAAIAVASGVMSLVENGAFRPSRPVSGVEAVAVIDRLEQLIHKTRRPGGTW